jgi:O-antigen ligase
LSKVGTFEEQKPAPTARRLSGILGSGALCLVVLSPLPFGSDRPLWWTLLAFVVGLLLAIYIFELVSGRRAPALSIASLLGILLPFAAMLVWAWLQALSITPESFQHPLWASAYEALGSPKAGAISINPEESRIGIMRLLTYAGVFCLFVQLGRERSFADRAVQVLAYAGFAYALYGLFMHVLGFERILWIRKWAYEGSVTSTFVNRNSYATYAALGLLCAGALFFNRIRDLLSMHAPLRRKLSLFTAIIASGGLWPLIAAVTIAMALLQTGSRAGTLSAFVGIIVFMIAAAFAELLRWRQAALLIVLFCAAGLLLLGVSGAGVVERMQLLDTDESARRAIYDLVLQAIAGAPALGTGLGTFPEIFAIYRGRDFDAFGTVSQAHNSYFESALELGIPATVLLIAALAAIAEANIVALRRRRRGRLFPVLGLAALTTVGLHSTVDFSLEIPAVAVTYAALAGVTCAQSFRSRRSRRRRGVNEGTPPPTSSTSAAQAP